MKKNHFFLMAVIIILLVFAIKIPNDFTHKNIFDSNNFIFIGHRDASGYAPEHIMPSYDMILQSRKAPIT